MEQRMTRDSGTPTRGRTAARAAFGLVVATACMFAAAQTISDRPTVWVCWQSGGAELACRLATTPALLSPPSDGAGDELDIPVPTGKIPLPEVVHTILRRPSELYGQEITIPLLSPPIDIAFAHELAQSVMCGANIECEALLAESEDAAALLIEEQESAAY